MIQIAQPGRRLAEVTIPLDYTILDDEQLMAHVAEGNTRALEILYDRYSGPVMGVALKMMNAHRATAEEVVQETFWRVWDNAATFQARSGSFSSWMFGIARNLCIDIWRKRKSRPQAVFTDEQAEQIIKQPDPAANVSESAWTLIKHSQVTSAVKVLPPAQRRVIEMAYFWGFTRQEIADELKVPLGTVHTRARLALMKLREALKDQGLED